MTHKELYEIANQKWEDCHGCNDNDKMFWINGFMKGAYLFGNIENLPNPQQIEEKGQTIGKLFNKLTSNQQDLNPEYQKIISDNFNDLL
jgi:hypothetical protein